MSRRNWALVGGIVVAAMAGLTGCQRVKKLLGRDKEEPIATAGACNAQRECDDDGQDCYGGQCKRASCDVVVQIMERAVDSANIDQVREELKGGTSAECTAYLRAVIAGNSPGAVLWEEEPTMKNRVQCVAEQRLGGAWHSPGGPPGSCD